MLNSKQNREKFVEKFGYSHHSYPVDERAANKILKAFDDMPDRYRNPDHLFSFIMQDRITYQMGERWIEDYKYGVIKDKITTEVLEFIDSI